MTAQLSLWATAVPEVYLPDVKWTDDAAKVLHRVRLQAQLIDCCTGLPCPTGHNGLFEYGLARCGRCGAIDTLGFLGTDHDHPGTPCPGAMRVPAGTPRWEVVDAWQALPLEQRHADRHDRKHWPDCDRCSCPRGVHGGDWPWADPEATRCWCRRCPGWTPPAAWPNGLIPDGRIAWYEQALTEAGLR